MTWPIVWQQYDFTLIHILVQYVEWNVLKNLGLVNNCRLITNRQGRGRRRRPRRRRRRKSRTCCYGNTYRLSIGHCEGADACPRRTIWTISYWLFGLICPLSWFIIYVLHCLSFFQNEPVLVIRCNSPGDIGRVQWFALSTNWLTYNYGTGPFPFPNSFTYLLAVWLSN